MSDPVLLNISGRLAQVTINRPSRRNALDNVALKQLLDAFDEIRTKSVSVLVIAGEGNQAFCAGSDLKALAAYSYAEANYHTTLFLRCTESLERLPCATIAAIEGYCLGGGLEIALACDARVCSSEAQLGFPEITVGALPTGGGTVLAPRMIGWARAREMLVFGERIDASTAHSWGLVSTLVDPGTAVARATSKGQQYAEKVPAESIALLKRILAGGVETADGAGRVLAAMADAILLNKEETKKKMQQTVQRS